MGMGLVTRRGWNPQGTDDWTATGGELETGKMQETGRVEGTQMESRDLHQQQAQVHDWSEQEQQRM